jgi:hypothetical protein
MEQGWVKTRRVLMGLLRFLNFVVLVSSWIALATKDAHAWGPGIHMIKGSYILENLHLILPSIAQLLKACPRDFLYGCVSADFFIGKGYRRRDDHCHNWSVGLKMLAGAVSPATKAFCYGYLAHLAADIVAHNYYIPNQLYLTASTKRLGHVYWEFRSDSHVDPGYWGIARKVVAGHNGANDASLEDAVKKKIVSLKTKKRVYVKMLNLADLDRWRRACQFVERNSRWDISSEEVIRLRDLSIALSVNFLHDPKASVCLDYDPVGSRNISQAKKLRRRITRSTGDKPVERIFEVPADLLQYRAIELEPRMGKQTLARLKSSP